MKILIAGGTGFVGEQLSRELLSAGHTVVVLTRNLTQARAKLVDEVDFIEWTDPESDILARVLHSVDCIINLAGESIGSGRWTKAKKEKILNSRIETTRTIVETIKHIEAKPKVLISASAIGFYGPCRDEELNESSPAGQDFLARVCTAWEWEAYRAKHAGVRVVPVRIGVVLGKGGALQRMLPLFRFYIGGPSGNGNQWFSWVHINDLVKIIRFIAENESVHGPVNATAPQPLKMRDFCSVLGKVMGRPSWLPVPGYILRLGLGEMADLVLNGQRVIPEKLLAAGYQFQYPTVEGALTEILSNSGGVTENDFKN